MSKHVSVEMSDEAVLRLTWVQFESWQGYWLCWLRLFWVPEGSGKSHCHFLTCSPVHSWSHLTLIIPCSW